MGWFGWWRLLDNLGRLGSIFGSIFGRLGCLRQAGEAILSDDVIPIRIVGILHPLRMLKQISKALLDHNSEMGAIYVNRSFRVNNSGYL